MFVSLILPEIAKVMVKKHMTLKVKVTRCMYIVGDGLDGLVDLGDPKHVKKSFEIIFLSIILPEIGKIMILKHVCLSFKVNGEGHAFDNAIFVFTELTNIRIDILFIKILTMTM